MRVSLRYGGHEVAHALGQYVGFDLAKLYSPSITSEPGFSAKVAVSYDTNQSISPVSPVLLLTNMIPNRD